MMDMLTALQGSALSTWLRESESMFALPGMLLIHTIGLGVLVGASWVVDLRVLGIASGIPLEPLRALFRVMWIGFAINLASGLLLFAQEAATKGTTTTFMTKMLLVALGVTTVVLIKRNLYGRGTGAAAVSRATKLLAVASLVVWTVAILAGRLLGYIVVRPEF